MASMEGCSVEEDIEIYDDDGGNSEPDYAEDFEADEEVEYFHQQDVDDYTPEVIQRADSAH